MKTLISGKVREVYEVNDREIVIVTTDRISAFDVILPTPIADKGVVLNKLALFWFDYTRDIVPNHIISDRLSDMPDFFHDKAYEDRTILVKKLTMMPYEFIVRGYMFGNMWKAYQNGEDFCGYHFDGDYELAQRLDSPILTPSTKAEEGHDIYIPMAQFESETSPEFAKTMSDICIAIYQKCYKYALTRGIIIADTKFEFGYDEAGNIVLADEILTPDSSRFWDASTYRTGISPPSYDKQFVRDWLIANKLDGVTPAPEIPADLAQKTSDIYKDCLHRLTD